MTRLAAACAAFLIASTAPAFADAGSEKMLRDFVAWIDASPDWSGSLTLVRSEGSDTIAEGMVFAREEPRVAISIEHLRLQNFGPRSGGGFAASEIEMNGGAVLTEFMEMAVPSGTAANVSMPGLAGVTFDIEHMMTSIARFYSAGAAGEVEALSIPEMVVLQRQPVPGSVEPAESRIVYRNISFGPLSGGVLEHQEAGPISISGSAPDGADLKIEVASISAERLDLAAFAHILDEARYRDGRGDNIWRPLLSAASYSGITGRGADGATFRIDEIAVENVDGRQPEEPFTALLDRVIDPSVPPEAKADLALEAVTGMFGAWRVGTIRVDGIAANAPKEGGSFALDGMSLTGMSNEGVDSFILKAMRADGPNGFLSLDALELAGFVPPDLKALMQFAAIEKDVDAQAHAEAVLATFAALPRLAHLGVHNLAAGKSKGESVTLASFTLDLADWNKVFAEATDIRIEGLAIPVALMELEGEAADVIGKLGLDQFVFGMSLADRWSPEAGTDSATWTFTLEDAADVALSYTLTGLTLDWLVGASAAAGRADDGNAALMAMLAELGLRDAELRVTDRALLDQAFGIAAEKQGLTIGGPVYREQMRAALPFLIATVAPADIAKQFSPPLQEFLAGGRTLVAKIAPATPLSVMALLAAASDPIGLTGLLNLAVTTEAAE